ncbi:MAG: hypothetical protein C0472_14540 [Erythrobacter sp.]|nr:hypothetical protein [Erythrobacter sp.]MBA4172363.1 hypothetical protein [Hyphomicrobium sp.]
MGTGASHTIAFVLLNLLMLAVLYGTRPGIEAPVSSRRIILGALLPVTALLLFFSFGEWTANDKSFTLKIDRFQISSDRMASGTPDAEGRLVYFVAGERPESSDLVVAPYADTARAAEYVRDEKRPIFEIVAGDPGQKAGDPREVYLCRYNYAASKEFELPGWQVTYKVGGTELAAAGPGRDCGTILRPGADAVEVALKREEIIGDATETFERRSFRVRRGGNGVEVRLDTPISTRIASSDPALFRLMPGLPLGETIDFLPQENALRPAVIGAGGLNPVIEPRFLGESFESAGLCEGDDPGHVWPASQGCNWHVAGTVIRHFIPWFLLIVFAVNATVVYVLRASAWRMARAELCIVLIVQWMLTLRALIGVAGLYADPGLVRSVVVMDVGMAFACAPAMAVLLLLRRTQSTGLVAVILATVAVLSYAALAISLGSTAGSTVPLVMVGMVCGLAAIRVLCKFEESLLGRMMSAVTGLTGPREMFDAGVALLMLALIPRVVLAAVGWAMNQVSSTAPNLSERIGPITLSAIYQPLLVIGFGLMLVGFVRAPSWGKAIAIFVLWGITLVAMPAFLGDFGIVWIYSWPLAMVIGWVALRAVLTRRALPAGLLSLLPLVPLGVVALAFYWSMQQIPQPGEGLLEDHLRAAVDWNERDEVRLLRFAAPEKLELLGNRRSFEMLDQAASLEPLVRGFWGQGYLEPSRIRAPISDYQYNDNLLAIHVMWPFGRFGVISLLAFIIGSAAIIAPRMRPRDMSPAAAISAIAAATIAWAAIYMTLANLNLAPFTGRNAYFLAVSSGGDVIEGLIFLLLAGCSWFAAPVPGKAEEEAA